jgi:paraquat-inducible protein B
MQHGYTIPVLIVIHPGRVAEPDTEEGVGIVENQIKVWIENGLRATLEMGNMVTGQQFIDLQNYEELGGSEIDYSMGYPVIPTISNEFAQITQKISAILNQINALPFEDLAGTVDGTLKDFAATAKTFSETGESLNEILKDSEQEELIKELTKTIAAFEVLAQSYSNQSETNRTLNQVLGDVQSLLLEVKPILNRVNESPSSLVIPADGNKQEIIPRAKVNK